MLCMNTNMQHHLQAFIRREHIRLLLLDEATSALDNHSEVAVQEALSRIRKGVTTIVIAHRLSTIQDVDAVFVVDKGRITESGTYSELLARGGAFTALVAAQAGTATVPFPCTPYVYLYPAYVGL